MAQEQKKDNTKKADEQKSPKKLSKDELASRLGVLAKNLPNQNELEQVIGMNIHSNTFFQKMLSTDVRKRGCKMHSNDYYKGMVFLDYLATTLLDDINVFNNLDELSNIAQKEIQNPYLTIDMVVIETGLYAKEKPVNYFEKKNIIEMKKRYDKENATVDLESAGLRPAEPYYDSIGLMIADLVDPKHHDYLANVSGRNELKAVIFTSSALPYIKDEEAKKNIYASLGENDYFGASLIAIDSLRHDTSLSDIQDQFTKAIFPKGSKDDGGKDGGGGDMTEEILGVQKAEDIDMPAAPTSKRKDDSLDKKISSNRITDDVYNNKKKDNTEKKHELERVIDAYKATKDAYLRKKDNDYKRNYARMERMLGLNKKNHR